MSNHLAVFNHGKQWNLRRKLPVIYLMHWRHEWLEIWCIKYGALRKWRKFLETIVLPTVITNNYLNSGRVMNFTEGREFSTLCPLRSVTIGVVYSRYIGNLPLPFPYIIPRAIKLWAKNFLLSPSNDILLWAVPVACVKWTTGELSELYLKNTWSIFELPLSPLVSEASWVLYASLENFSPRCGLEIWGNLSWGMVSSSFHQQGKLFFGLNPWRKILRSLWILLDLI